MKDTQINQIEAHLRRGDSITPLDALKLYGCMRLAAVVHVLRSKFGLPIRTTIVDHPKTGKSFARYTLNPADAPPPAFGLENQKAIIANDLEVKHG